MLAWLIASWWEGNQIGHNPISKSDAKKLMLQNRDSLTSQSEKTTSSNPNENILLGSFAGTEAWIE